MRADLMLESPTGKRLTYRRSGEDERVSRRRGSCSQSAVSATALTIIERNVRIDIHAVEGIIPLMACEVEHTDEFEEWWKTLSETEQEDVAAIVGVLEERGANLPFPYSSGIESSKHSHMRELRIQSGGRPIRVFYALDPRRMGILLIGGDKTGNDRFYEEFVPVADKLYDDHITQLRKEKLIR